MSSGRHHRHSNSVKLEAIRYAATNSVAAAARKYGVAPKSIRDWQKFEEQLKRSMTKFHLEGSGPKPKFIELEEKLFLFYKEKRASKLLVS